MNAKTIRVLLGLAILGGSILLGLWALVDLMRAGSCSSGGVYVSTNVCAPGTGGKILALMGGILGALVGTVVAGNTRAAFAAWGLGFGALSAAFFVAAFGPAAPVQPDFTMKGVSIGVGGMFLLMALPGLFIAVAPDSDERRRGITIEGAYGSRLTVDAPEDGGPAAIVLANRGR